MASGHAKLDVDVAGSFKQALRAVASSVAVITAHDGKRCHGMTATAVMSVSMEPPALAVCINQSSLLHEILTAGERFCVNFLDEGHQAVSVAFSGGLPAEARFGSGRWATDEEGLRYLEDARSIIFCDKVSAVPFGTHTLFIGQVSKTRSSGDGSPLVYHNAGYCSALPLI
ncbi:MAG: flavin reductase [Sphingomonas sp.]|jgi:flavin reductase (DIM6/NTAB) family NADH-FMN oxidoreductase RutF|nr:flavin reductase [Sphingomonas sp.]